LKLQWHGVSHGKVFTITHKRWKRLLWAYGLVSPAALWLAAVVFYPTLQAVFVGFTDLNLLDPSSGRWVGWNNFVVLWHDPLFWLALKHSLWLTLLAVPLEFWIGMLLALALRRPLPGILTVRAVLLSGWISSTVAQVIMFKTLLRPDGGLFSQWLNSVGLGMWVRNWFADPQFSLGTVVVLHVWRNAPFFGIGLLAVMLTLPKNLYEVARMDGASAWAQFIHITLPQLRLIATALVLGHVVFTLTDYTLVAVATGGGPLHATEIVPTYLYRQAWSLHELGMASATGTVLLGLLALFATLYVRHMWRHP